MHIDQTLDQLDTPCVLVDLDVLERNIERMARFAVAQGVTLRPHAKSHKTLGVAERQRAAGCTGLTVAKLDEADAFLAAGFDDLFIANEVVGEDKWRRLVALQQRGQVAIGIDSPEAADGLNAVASAEGVAVPVLIEVDSGLGRAGVLPGDPVLQLAQHLSRLRHLRVLRPDAGRAGCGGTRRLRADRPRASHQSTATAPRGTRRRQQDVRPGPWRTQHGGGGWLRRGLPAWADPAAPVRRARSDRKRRPEHPRWSASARGAQPRV